MTAAPHTPDDPLLAAELALSLLEGDEARAARTRLLNDRDFAAEVQAWEEHLASLEDPADALSPSPSAKRALDARLFGAAQRPRWWGWPAFGIGSALTAAALIAFIVIDPFAPPPKKFGPANVAVAELAATDGSLRMTAVLNHADRTVYLAMAGAGAATGRAYQLWGLPAQGNPVSIGVLPAGENASFVAPAVLVPELPGLRIAISDEPAGGSPTGQPTGPVLAVGELVEF